ncbi:MAG: hypothetical protein H8E48_10650 [Chloroflexi bacterium]|nr:hypothetical protein [Chloroflexota bacterium]
MTTVQAAHPATARYWGGGATISMLELGIPVVYDHGPVGPGATAIVAVIVSLPT